MMKSIMNPENMTTVVYPHLTHIFQKYQNLSTRNINESDKPRPHVRNMVLITSVLYTLNYVGKNSTTHITEYHPMSKSIYTHEERFEQTKKTIERARQYIPDCDIFFMECSPLSDKHHEYLAENTDYFFNLFDTELRDRMFTASKAMGEGTLTEYALCYIFREKISFDNLFKFSGRYYLDERFCYDHWDNDRIIVREFSFSSKNVFTFLYKMTKKHALQWLYFLIENEDNLRRCVGYEYIYGDFVAKNINDVVVIDCFGIEGFISPDGSHVKV